MNVVIDASALIAFLYGETGADVVAELLLEGNKSHIHAINLCEMYYDFRRAYNEQEAQRAVKAVLSIGIEVREDMDAELWMLAGSIKADIRRISFADCFCLALAKRIDAEVVTADRREFEPLVQKKLCAVRFIR